MNSAKKELLPLIAMNFFPLFFTAGGVALCFGPLASLAPWVLGLTLILYVYLLPPLLSRLVFFFVGRPERKQPLLSAKGLAWWFSAQTQILFLRFPAFEELLRLVPMCYSFWLRLWGSRIGKNVYWSPGVHIMDRPFLVIGDYAVIGYGAGFSSHYTEPNEQKAADLFFGLVEIGDRATVGGAAGMGAGSRLTAEERLPATFMLAPFYEWSGGRRHARKLQ